MISRSWILLILALLPAALRAQAAEDSPQKEDVRRLSRDAQEAIVEARLLQVEEQLRDRVRQRFAQRVVEDLELTEQQAAQLEFSARRFATDRAEMAARVASLSAALRHQLQPQVQAISDSVARLTDQLAELQLRRAKLQQEEVKRLADFLTPVQRARYLAMQKRLHEVIEEALEQSRPYSRRDSSRN